jgi:hypothetical protein
MTDRPRRPENGPMMKRKRLLKLDRFFRYGSRCLFGH